MISGRSELRQAVRDAVRDVPTADIFTRLTIQSLWDTERRGIDLLLTSPALLREAEAYRDIRLASDDLTERADAVFSALFVERSPVSAYAQAALLSLKKLGLNPGDRDLSAIRSEYRARPAGTRAADVLDAAGLSFVAVQAGLFESVAAPVSDVDERFRISICLDMLADPNTAWPALAVQGCFTLEAARDFIIACANKLEAASFFVERPFEGALWSECVLPAIDVLNIPVLPVSRLPLELPDAKSLAQRIAKEGMTFHPYCSGAITLEELPGLWRHMRWALEKALEERYMPLLKSGWRLLEGEIAHDASQILSNVEKGEYC